MLISAVLVREEAAPLTPTVAVISPVRTVLVVNLLQRPPPQQPRQLLPPLRLPPLQLKVKSRNIVHHSSLFGSLKS